MRIAVMGVGGLGGYFGGMLARSGEAVSFIARGATLEALRSRGLTLKLPGGEEFTRPARAASDPAEIGPVDLVIFCVKTYDTETAAQLIGPMVAPETLIMPLQNGVDNFDKLGKFFSPQQLIGGMPGLSSRAVSPGVYELVYARKLQVGELDGSLTPRIQAVHAAFHKAGVPTEISREMRVDLWKKLVLIAGFAGVGALSRLNMGQLRACPETLAFYRGVMEEATRVGQACGVPLSDSLPDHIIADGARASPAGRPSMYYDLAAGRRLELESITGAVVRLGREQGVATPYNFAIYAALKPYANGAPD